jgi:hypothetical protein
MGWRMENKKIGRQQQKERGQQEGDKDNSPDIKAVSK